MKEYTKSKLNRVKRGANRAVYDQEEINKIIDAGFLGYVSYTYDGVPISIPMAYGRIGNKIYLHGSNGNRMLKSLLSLETVSITITHLDALVLARSGFHHSVNYRSATIFGAPKKIEDDEQKEVALKCVLDYMIPNRWDSLREMSQKELDQTLVIEISIDTASAKIRNVGAIDEPEDEVLPIWAGIVPIVQKVEKPVSDEKLNADVEIPPHVIEYYENHK
ncbi:pyridoxamine 5'-phosphate oxidase family protein [Tenacibaculum xiamenense]|uniref:pyridoxamine 5'-phosphate oxidase family protein n=1 Tax=Tenacibaculum xiamenense TaxID=1261553 RepID=UPI00389679A9